MPCIELWAQINFLLFAIYDFVALSVTGADKY